MKRPRLKIGARVSFVRDGRTVNGTVLSLTIPAGARGWQSNGWRPCGWVPTVYTTAGTVAANRVIHGDRKTKGLRVVPEALRRLGSPDPVRRSYTPGSERSTQ